MQMAYCRNITCIFVKDLTHYTRHYNFLNLMEIKILFSKKIYIVISVFTTGTLINFFQKIFYFFASFLRKLIQFLTFFTWESLKILSKSNESFLEMQLYLKIHFSSLVKLLFEAYSEDKSYKWEKNNIVVNNKLVVSLELFSFKSICILLAMERELC